MKQRNANPLVIWFTKLTGVIPSLLFLLPKVYYVDKSKQGLRIKKGTILMSNHKSLFDFVLYYLIFFTNTIRFLMAEVLFNKSKIFAWFLFSLGGVYVNRDTFDFTFMQESIKILEKGGIVGIFPEGRLPVNNKPFPFKPSISYIALHSGADIVPVYTDGNYAPFKRTRVVIGVPFNLREMSVSDNPDEKEIARLTDILKAKNDELKEYLENIEKA